jgi:hypothetical protein
MAHAALARHYRSLNPTYIIDTVDKPAPESFSTGVLLDGILTVEFPPELPAGREYRFAVGDAVDYGGLAHMVRRGPWRPLPSHPGRLPLGPREQPHQGVDRVPRGDPGIRVGGA